MLVTVDCESELLRTRKERDLYRKLLDLGFVDTAQPFLKEALALVAEIADATRGYIALGSESETGGNARWWTARGLSEEELEREVRKALSEGVIAEAISSGHTIVTESALTDPRFMKRSSVKRNRIEAVLCAPIGASPPIGVVYLQNRAAGGAFSEEDRARIELFARHLLPLADRLLMREARRESEDPTQSSRASSRSLKVHNSSS